MPRTRSTQKLPSSPVLRAGEAAHQRHRHGHADRGGDEVLHRQAGHLHQVALGGLAGVGLPVGVGDEADRGVPRQRRRHRRGGVVEVQRQLALHQLEDEQEQDADRRERQHAAGVGAPGLFGLRVGADQPVDRRVRPGCPCAGVDAVHVVAERHVHERQRDDQGCEEDDPRRSWYSLEPLREQQGRERETARRRRPAPGRPCWRGSSFDQSLGETEQREDGEREEGKCQNIHADDGRTVRRKRTVP